MANDRRRSHHDGNGVMKPASARSPKTPKSSQAMTKSFSFRNEHGESKNSSPHTGSRRSSDSSRSTPREFGDSDHMNFLPSKAMRRNSCGSNFYATSTAKAKRRNSMGDNCGEEYAISFRSTDHTTPLSYRDSERTETRSFMSNEDEASHPIVYISNEIGTPTRSIRKNLSTSQHSREKSLRFSQHSTSRRLSNDYSESGKRKARRRNSNDYEYPAPIPHDKPRRKNSLSNSFSEEFNISYVGGNHSNRSNRTASKPLPSSHSGHDHEEPRPSSSRAKASGRSPKPAKATRRNSIDKSPKSSKSPPPPPPPPPRVRRRNSCDYDPHSSNVDTFNVDSLQRRNSWHDSYAEENQRQSKAAEQRQPRRLKSNPNPGSNHKPKKKKKSSSSKKLSSKTSPKETPKKNQQTLRLNSQLMRKIGDFRPYFVPLKKKQEVLNSSSQASQTFSLSQEIVSHTVNDGPAQILHEGMKNISVASFLHEGVPVVKISHSKLGKLRKRVLTLSEDHTSLFLTHSKLAKGTRNIIPKQPAWTPSKGWNGTYIRSVDVANICDFQVGIISSRWLELSVANYAKKGKMRVEDNSSLEDKSKDFLPYMPDPARVAQAVTIFHIDPRTGRMDSLDFFIENQDHRRAVVATLALMKYTYDEVSQLVGNEILLYRYIIKDMNLGTSDTGMTEMNELEFSALCRRLNFSGRNVGKEFREFNKQHKKNLIDEGTTTKNKLPIHECLQLIQLLKGKENPSIAAWRACFGTATCVNALTVLTKFLHGPQQEEKLCDIQDARDLVNVMNATELGEVLSNRKGSLLTQWQFQEFLRSEWNDIYCPEKRVIDNERVLDKPLSHYWINSSFRTSLMSDGTPSVQSYTRALLRGCKSIDLNCWDGIILPSGECVPIIIPSDENPGTSFKVKDKLTFRSVVLVVRKYLMDNRKSYPIMFNLENNCSAPFQRSMAKTMKELFGKKLYIPTSDDRKKQLPSPEDLRGMIVVNVRKPFGKGKDEYRSKSFCGDGVDAYSKMFNTFVKPDSFKKERTIPESASFRSFNTKNNRADKQIGEDLISLSLFHDMKFSGYFLESMDLTCSQTHSIKDILVPKIVKEYSDNPDLWRKYNGSHLTRIYPNADGKNKNDSSKSHSNYNPVLAWGMGCQMATLNFHNDDTALAVNDGFFRQTGGIGYIEKPKWLLGSGKRPKSTSIKIRLLSGSCIPKPFVGGKDGPIDDNSIGNPRVVIELHDVTMRRGHGERFKISKHKVECSNKNGFFPIFDDKGKKFTVETPDVAMLVFRVEQNTGHGKVISTTAVPVSCIRKGYRSVQLYDVDNTRHGHFASATLLVFLM